MTPLLEADCVSKAFEDQRVLTSASLRAVPGELRALLGRNGAGKSTLLKIACGVVTPDSGVVRFDGETHLRSSLAALARLGVFYWPDRDLFSAGYSVRRQLTMFQRQFGGRPVAEVAASTLTTDLLGARPDELSGGERRRAELAAVLVRQPRCLLADEPYRGIDPKDAEVLTTHLLTLARSGTAVVVTGHEVPTLLAAADQIIWCTSGTTYDLGPPDSARGHASFVQEYLGARDARSPGGSPSPAATRRP